MRKIQAFSEITTKESRNKTAGSGFIYTQLKNVILNLRGLDQELLPLKSITPWEDNTDLWDVYEGVITYVKSSGDFSESGERDFLEILHKGLSEMERNFKGALKSRKEHEGDFEKMGLIKRRDQISQSRQRGIYR